MLCHAWKGDGGARTGRKGDTFRVRQPIVVNALEREKPDNGKDGVCDGGGQEGREHRGVVPTIWDNAADGLRGAGAAR